MPFDPIPRPPADDERSSRPTDVYSLDGLIAWLRTQPPDKTYCYMNIDNCLIAQYLIHHGCYRRLHSHELKNIDGGSFYHVANHEIETFGAALNRAIALARERAREVAQCA